MGKQLKCLKGKGLETQMSDCAVHRYTAGIMAFGKGSRDRRNFKSTKSTSAQSLKPQLTRLYGCKFNQELRLPDCSKVLVAKHQKYLLKSHWSGEKVHFAQACANHLRSMGFRGGGMILNTKAGKSSFRRNGRFYYLQTYVGGTKVRLPNMAQTTSLFRLLGQIHKYGEGFVPPAWRVSPKVFPCNTQVLRQGMDYLEEVYHNVIQSRHRSVLDELFLDSYCYFKDQGDLAICQIEQSGINDLLAKLSERGNLCYPSISDQAARFLGDHQAVLNDYTGCQLGLPVYDVAILLIKTMTEYGWSSALKGKCLSKYQDTRPLTAEEMGVMHGLLAFPFSYWRVIHTYYQSRQFHESLQGIMCWETCPEVVIQLEAKVSKILNRLLEQEGKRRNFLSELTD